MSEAEQVSAPSTDYILVALDTSPYSAAALTVAAEVAATLNLELRGIYVEDVNLLHLCGLPFGLEIGSFTANPRRLEQAHMERDFRLQAAQLRRAMADIAGRQRVSWSFKVVRGGVTQEVLSAGSSAQMVSIGRVGTTPGKRTGSTAQAVVRNTQRPVIVQAQKTLEGPFTVVYMGDASSDNAMRLAIQLAKQRKTSIGVLAMADVRSQADAYVDEMTENEIEFKIYSLPKIEAMDFFLSQLGEGAVILPVSVATWMDQILVTVIVTP